jgi:hypothetical protein
MTAYTAAVQRAVSEAMNRNGIAANEIERLTVRDLPNGPQKQALMRRRFVLGLPMCPNGRVMVDETGHPLPAYNPR